MSHRVLPPVTQALLCVTLMMQVSCAARPPAQPLELCAIFDERPGWHRSAKKMQQRWGIPVPVAMAFVQRESAYRAKAKPPRTKLLWVIPWRRPSSAYGYAQATDPAWREYLADAGGRFSSRDRFSSAIDFIGWYNARSARTLGIPKTDAYHLYVAYYAGPGGYRTGRWQRDRQVRGYAEKVAARAASYTRQFSKCPNPPRRFWFF
ncbi:MAG: hypothetical protein AAF648_13910 [Pseudomonadota bacterium]